MQGGKARRKRRNYNTRLIRRFYSYSIQEIAELFDVHVNAVRRWIKNGLPTIDYRKPFLVHGSDLIDFLDYRQSQRKQRCTAEELYCCRCRAPRRPYLNIVELKVENANQVRLKAKCSTCGATMNRIGSTRKLTFYRSLFVIQTTEQGHIRGRLEPGVICHLDEANN